MCELMDSGAKPYTSRQIERTEQADLEKKFLFCKKEIVQGEGKWCVQLKHCLLIVAPVGHIMPQSSMSGELG